MTCSRLRTRLSAIVFVVGLSMPLSCLMTSIAQAQSQGGAPAAKAAAMDADQVPIRKITLYRSGVGFFEREGSVQGDASVQLRFSTEQINDILKTMVLIDVSGGRIDAVSYGSKEPLARRLASFGVNISDNPSVPNLLNQLRGAAIRVSAGEQITGTILGVEERLVPPGKDQQAIRVPFLNLLTATGVRSVAVNDIASFEILDKELAGELNKALAALAEYRADRSKTVDLHFAANGQTGARRVVVASVDEMPVWKTSYRLILPDEVKKSGGEKDPKAAPPKPSTLNVQGWAIVENNTDQDWNDVGLALVSGRPVSFQMDLYEPLYVSRPFIPVPMIPGVAPRAYSGGVDGVLADAMRGEMEGVRKLASRVSARGAAAGSPPAPSPQMDSAKAELSDALASYAGLSAGEMADYSARAQAAAGEVGEVFQYELEAPVTIARQHSAMIPILTAAVSGRRVSIFSSSDGSEYPMRGVELTNTSNLQLLPGPIAVFDGNDGKSAYAGDAQIGHVGQGDKRLLAYAVDLDVKTLKSAENTNTVTKLRIVDGMFEQTVKSQNQTSYAFKNADQKRDRAIILEHAKMPGWTLVTPQKAAEETQSLYRFEVPIASGKSETISVVQERVELQRVGVMTFDLATILRFQKDGKLSAQVVETVRELGRQQATINAAEQAVQEIDRQTAEINKDQNRIRENMGRIERNSQLYTRYMTKLTEQETQLEDLNTRRVQGQEKVDSL
ncbi:MAG: hypothetical protein H7210_11900, partial [Pyrinomonadaceae bacterium]|nr:hypothetical protein [Phycisphaerales bacterium]